eukprot:scaffold5682_cov140-Cylindrotheca_fusiformis.AAC.19
MSRPSPSLLGDEPSRRRSAASTANRSRQPPISEVHVQDEEDTFFECVEDRSLARRTRRSLLTSPTAKSSPQQAAAASIQTTSSLGDYSQNDASTENLFGAHLASFSSPSPQNGSKNRSKADVSTDEIVRVHGNALQALVHMKDELLKMQEANQALKQEKLKISQDRDAVNKSFQQYKAEQQGKMEQLKGEREEWLQEKNNLETQLRNAAREKKESMHRKLAADNRQKEWKTQIEGIKVELETTLHQKQELASDLARAKDTIGSLESENESLTQQLESQMANDSTKIQELRLEVEEKDKQIKDLNEKVDARTEEGERLRRKLAKYKEALKEANEAVRARPALKSPSSRSGRSNGSAGVRFQEDDGGLDTTIADRLARMRDSAERAQMIRVHKRELSRFKVDKESELQKMAAEHEEAMRKVSREATSKLNAKLEELRMKLQEEHEEKTAELEKRHNQKFSEMQQEFLRSQEDADEALRAALVKVAEASQEYEKEASLRVSAQKALDSLNQQLDSEKQNLQEHYESELEKYRLQWEDERETLLSMIQKECNTAFDSHRRGSNGGARATHSASQRLSPTSTLHSFFPPTLTVNVGRQGRVSSPSESAQLISPSHSSDIESVLKETENLIQSIM